MLSLASQSTMDSVNSMLAYPFSIEHFFRNLSPLVLGFDFGEVVEAKFVAAHDDILELLW